MSPSGYWPTSPWPVESGGSHRPTATDLPGPTLGPTDHLVATVRNNSRWNVMMAHRNPGELFLYGTTLPHEPEVACWVERVDAETLEPLAGTGDLPAGGHAWPGGMVAHRNGDLYVTSGAYLHRVTSDCELVGSLPLPIDHAHDGLLILNDGMLVTKDVRLDPNGAASTLTVCDEDLGVVTVVPVPEPSMGRLAAVDDCLYVAGTTRVFRYLWSGTDLTLDERWQPQYRQPDRGCLLYTSPSPRDA